MSDVTTALLVVDVQRGLVEGPGAVAGAGRLVERLAGLVDRARAAGALVVHLRDDGVHDPSIRRGTPGWELALTALPEEAVVAKEADDGFEGTDLADLLGTAGVDRVVVVGLQSEMCVAATARGALARGLHVVLPRDGHLTHDVPPDGRGAPGVPADLVSRVAEWSLGDTVEIPTSVADVDFERTAE